MATISWTTTWPSPMRLVYGKGFSMYYRVGPRVLADLEAAGLNLDTAE